MVDTTKKFVAETFGLDVEDVRMVHVYRELALATDVEADSLAEVVQQRIVNIELAEGESFESMLRTKFSFTLDTADRIQIDAGLRHYIPGLIAQESLYNPNVVSNVGAKGPMQITSDTWSRHSDEGMDIHSLADSMVVASRYFEASYTYMTRNLESELSYIEQEYFDGNHAAFVEHFLILLLINGYNAGDGNMKKVIEWFVQEYPNKSALEQAFDEGELRNKDVYFAMSQLARRSEELPKYGGDAGPYDFNIIGWSSI